MTDFGKLPSGGPLVVNSLAAEADLVVAEGFIEPHFFAGFSGGLSRLVGPAGGFLLSYPLMAWITGRSASGVKLGQFAAGLLISTAVCYIMGSLMYAAVTGLGFKAAVAACVLPFLAGDILKMVLAAWFGTKLKKALARAEV